MNTRRKRLEKYCNALNCDALVTFEPENLFYLTGFWGEAIGVLEKGGKTIVRRMNPDREYTTANGDEAARGEEILHVARFMSAIVTSGLSGWGDLLQSHAGDFIKGDEGTPAAARSRPQLVVAADRQRTLARSTT